MVIANLGECAGLCRVGIALCLVMVAFGEQGQIKFINISVSQPRPFKATLTFIHACSAKSG
jgi:hypothetical protein